MQEKMMSKSISVTVVILFISYTVLAGCNNNTEKDDPESLKAEQEQQQELIEERKDTTKQKSPVFETTLQATSKSIGDTEATGSATLTLEDDSIHITGKFSGLTSDYTGSYIHQALQSERVQQLDPTLDPDQTSGSWESSYKLNKGDISMLKEDSLYISVYSKKYESGELRGQLIIKEEDDIDTVQQ